MEEPDESRMKEWRVNGETIEEMDKVKKVVMGKIMNRCRVKVRSER